MILTKSSFQSNRHHEKTKTIIPAEFTSTHSSFESEHLKSAPFLGEGTNTLE